jgi:hypothetical protein
MASQAICANKQKAGQLSLPGPCFQDPRIRVDSAQRCFKKATEKSNKDRGRAGALE